MRSFFARSAIAGLLLFAAAGFAQPPYYQGKTLTLVVPFSAGGGTDTFARAIAPYFEKHIEGNPRVLVENQKGGGGLNASNTYVLNTPKDGTTLLVGASQHTLRVMLGMKGSRVNLDKLKPLLGTSSGQLIYVSPDTGINGAEELADSESPLYFGYHDPLGYSAAILSMELLGVSYKPVSGYSGKGEVGLAFERGEVNIDMQNTLNYAARVEPLIEEGTAVPLFTVGRFKEGRFVRDPVAPELPTVWEVYEEVNGTAASGPNAKASRIVLAAVTGADKPVWVHRDAPEEALDALTAAVEAMANDPEFVEELKELGTDGELLRGGELNEALDAMLDMDVETQEWLREFFGERFGVEFEASQ